MTSITANRHASRRGTAVASAMPRISAALARFRPVTMACVPAQQSLPWQDAAITSVGPRPVLQRNVVKRHQPGPDIQRRPDVSAPVMRQLLKHDPARPITAEIQLQQQTEHREDGDGKHGRRPAPPATIGQTGGEAGQHDREAGQGQGRGRARPDPPPSQGQHQPHRSDGRKQRQRRLPCGVLNGEDTGADGGRRQQRAAPRADEQLQRNAGGNHRQQQLEQPPRLGIGGLTRGSPRGAHRHGQAEQPECAVEQNEHRLEPGQNGDHGHRGGSA